MGLAAAAGLALAAAGTVSFLNSGFLSCVWAGVAASSQPAGNSGVAGLLHSAAMYFLFSYFCRMKASMAWSFCAGRRYPSGRLASYTALALLLPICCMLCRIQCHHLIILSG